LLLLLFLSRCHVITEIPFSSLAVGMAVLGVDRATRSGLVADIVMVLVVMGTVVIVVIVVVVPVACWKMGLSLLLVG
jgi:heme/copper-type cytochrome/quinol oxidase subunit 2